MSCENNTTAEKLAQELGSSGIPARGRRPNGYWKDFTNLERELIEFVLCYGTLGVMPKLIQLENAGLGYLLRPIRDFGGTVEVAKRLGWIGVWKHSRPTGELPSDWESVFVDDLASNMDVHPDLVRETLDWWHAKYGDEILVWNDKSARRKITERIKRLKRKRTHFLNSF